MAVAHTGMDVLFHDTFYVIGHFHIMFGGSAMLGIYAAFYFYFPVLYGVKFSRIYAYIHYTYYISNIHNNKIYLKKKKLDFHFDLLHNFLKHISHEKSIPHAIRI